MSLKVAFDKNNYFNYQTFLIILVHKTYQVTKVFIFKVLFSLTLKFTI